MSTKTPDASVSHTPPFVPAIEGRKAAFTLGSSHISDLSPKALWPFIADFHNIHRINPFVRRTETIGAASCSVGAERVCHMDAGMGLQEKVVAWHEGESYSVALVRTPPMLQIDAGVVTLGVRPHPRGAELFMQARYQHRFGVLGRAMNAVFTAPAMRIMFALFLSTIDRRVRRGLSAPSPQREAA